MAFSHEFQRYRSVRLGQMLQGLVISILLHSTLLIGSKYWLRAFMSEPKQEIPIEVVEVYPNKTHIPQKTSFRATKDSIAGGKALPKKPVSAVKSANSETHKASSKSPVNLTALSPAKVFQSEPRQQKAESARIPPESKPQPTAIAPAPPEPKPKKKAVAPNTTLPPILPRKIAIAPANIPPVAKPKNLGQSGTRLSRRTPSQAQSSLKTGAASLLGGTVGVSSRNFSGNYLASLPNSNRDRQAPSSIDASSQNIDITSYLKQLQQQVKQQWLPEVGQSSRRTVLNFTINRSGQLSNLQLAETSGFSITDQAALKAIQRAAPFAPLPTGYASNHIHIEFTFNINVYGQLNLSRDGD